MQNYVDYEYYVNTYRGNMSECDFDKLVIRASAEIRKHILNKNIEGHEEEVKYATCSVTDILNKIEQLENRKSKLASSDEKIITSEQIKDLSRSYANVTNIKDIDEEINNQKSKIFEEIESHLLFTGLLNRRVGVKR